MQQGRGWRGEYSEESRCQQRCVEPHDKVVVRLDFLHQQLAQVPEFGDVAQVFATEGHVGGFPGDVAGVAHGQPEKFHQKVGPLLD